jgi:hypothetical protein
MSTHPPCTSEPIDKALGELKGKQALVYIDDVITPSKTIEEGFQNLEKVLTALSSAGFRLNYQKCTFFTTETGRHCLSIQKKNCNPYFIVIMITVLIMNVIFWVVNFKTQNYFVISTTQNVYLRLSMYDCSNFVYSCRIFGISELRTV